MARIEDIFIFFGALLVLVGGGYAMGFIHGRAVGRTNAAD